MFNFKKIPYLFLAAATACCCFAADRPLEFNAEQFKVKNDASVEWNDQTLFLKIHNPAQNSGAVIQPPEGTKFDFSQAKYLVCEVENLSETHQMRLAMHISSGERGKLGETHVDAIPPREINSGIGLNPGEKRTLRMLLPHASLFLAPEGGKNLRVLDTKNINGIEFLLSWPVEAPRKYLVDCKVTGIRLEGEAQQDRKITGSNTYFPFVDVYGQYIHADWPEKIRSDADLVENHKRELAELALTPYPAEWNAYGGWANGPTLRATGSFRVEQYQGKWFFVDPSGKLFWSTGIDVLLPNTDSVSREHPEWFASDVPKQQHLPFNAWNLQKKYGTAEYQQEFFRTLTRRLPAWGMNTVGCWGAPELMDLGRFPYTLSLGELLKGFPRFKNQNVKFYDVFDPEFEAKMGNILRDLARFDSFLRKSIDDPMCIGYFIDNELEFRHIIPGVIKAEPDQPAKQEFIRELKAKYADVAGLNRAWGTDFTDWDALAAGKTEPQSEGFRADSMAFRARFVDRYYEICWRGIKSAAPHRLYLGSRMAAFKQDDDIWAAAAKYCDVISVNTYMDSMANIIAEKLHDKPVLIGEFHFGVIDRGMFDGGLCRSGDQESRATAYIRFMQGALVQPNMVGAHWFQFRDQPLTGRWGGEGYAVGFVDVADTPYPELCKAAREVGEFMYQYRMNGRLVNAMNAPWNGQEALARSRSFEILKAEYGADNAFADVREKTAALLRQGDTLVAVSNQNFGDPAPGQSKRLRLTLTYRGNPVVLSGNEGTVLDLSERRLAALAVQEIKAASYHGPLEILKAEYGAGNRVVDVTTTVKALLADGERRISVGNANFGDPLHRVRKQLRIIARYQGKPLTLQADEATILDLDRTIRQ